MIGISSNVQCVVTYRQKKSILDRADLFLFFFQSVLLTSREYCKSYRRGLGEREESKVVIPMSDEEILGNDTHENDERKCGQGRRKARTA